MLKWSFLGLLRRRLASSVAVAAESPIVQADSHRGLSSFNKALYPTPGSSSGGAVAGLASSLGNRYFHASGYFMRLSVFRKMQAEMRLKRLFARLPRNTIQMQIRTILHLKENFKR
ncbi:unnamed protein product [Malus baccata var. baccata]